jgi:hypothetical protein
MKKKYTLLLLLITFGAMAQTDCKSKVLLARRIMESKALFKPYDKIFQDLLPCADAGNAEAQNYIGLMCLEGLGVEKDATKAFTYLELAAKNNNAVAQFNLGNMYREGKGCAINMIKAVEWFQKAADNKNSRAAYSLGYMYLKGYGVPQDYAVAVSWFEKSTFPMAKHWLGVCYYLGYGVPQNTPKALEYLYGNSTLNSVAFLKNLKIDKRETVLNQAEQAINEANEGDKKITPELIATSREIVRSSAVESQELTTKNILGEWTGRLIEYDWSGTTPLRILPIEVAFSKNELGDLQTKITFEGKTFDDLALFENNNLFLQGFQFKLAQLYPQRFDTPELDYNVLGMDMSLKTVDNTPFLLADVDANITTWNEPAPPISLVLRAKNQATTPEDDALFLALASQKAEFIKVYPVPFQEQLYVGFELENAAQVQVTLTSVATAHTVQVATTYLEEGIQSYTVNTADLPNGYYVIRVQENEKLHTRVVIKQ